jgi:dihydropteroate synthase
MMCDPRIDSPVRRIGGRSFDFARHIAVMAIVNRTPDSFYDRGATFALEAAVAAGHAAVGRGAEVVDVGGVKFAAGPPVPVDEEVARVVPVVRELASAVAVSVDTFHARVARAAIDAGAGVINDTSGLSDSAMADVVADSDASLVIVHSLAVPRTRYPHPRYADVVTDVGAFLRERVELAISRGIPRERIIVDPGHDLNKNTLHSLELTARLEELTGRNGLGLPLLVALSNKDFVGEALERGRGDRIAGSLAAAVYCAMQGARIVRAHNVAETVDAMRMVETILGWREPPHLIHNMPLREAVDAIA